jgi:DNA helicase HerA-like ATPase
MERMTAVHDRSITYFAKTNHRNAGVPFGIRLRDRRSHFYVVGKTGTGKSTLLRTMLAQEFASGGGCALFDPHGDLLTEVLALVPKYRANDVILVEPVDVTSRWRFNPLRDIDPAKRAVAVAGLLDVFRKIWPDDWGPRLEHLLRNVLFTLVERPGSTFADIPKLLADKNFRSDVISDLSNESVREFWVDEFARYSPGFRAVVVAPLQNKIGALLTDPVLNRFFTAEGDALDIRRIMDQRKIFLVNLDKGRLGEGSAAILGSFLLSYIALVGVSRSEQPETAREDFFVYLDEFQTFTTQFVATMLSELRKYRVGMVLAHQHISQLDPVIRDAVFGNAGSIVSFRVGAADAAYLAREFSPTFAADDLTGLPRYCVYLRLLIDGETSSPFSATTLGSLAEIPNWEEFTNTL